jgi:hypothetical protein
LSTAPSTSHLRKDRLFSYRKIDAKTIFIKIYVVAVKLSFGEVAHALAENLFVSIMRNPLITIIKIKIEIRFSDALPATEVFKISSKSIQPFLS